MGRRAGVILASLVALAIAGGMALTLIASNAGGSFELRDAPDKVLAPDRQIFCHYVSRTGAAELLQELADPSRRGSRDTYRMFADKVAGRAPRPVRSDAEAVSAAARRLDTSERPSRSELAAARRVDAFAASHCP